ncbi:MAG: UDP-N-acetylmuramoyl-L-alanine--D-glutamate ligase [Sulfurimonas sp. RIFOXYD12_FULL_33_39]|uniref:UDP-N-acetylmuramoyl-L-alanine--D-glutamate ligase n=1 Tax=unclassified Sulfurimonas TaxID=2623549 RepID=UPI0008C557A6|nr:MULTISPECIES: UDP-N-acetylmuramoyl-L-alanine--D-glutamate ligase [unclassified Sulfurimonas]OHE06537.1 MAG: UDP-N-acetylmuramoyl-L-alanine--D-glutamate ligase [Sulfurimonas sp. RIFCSPLOWO2_12_FULL_34_6]OHE08714.1 MAG: UDP-N-acetylmuramoyl-L-alanine--D-glutamate ligase [Sulfurimonas sp. RIFOXYD12_FULL_33_39]OHE13999.1 MAG: UDP-N-acetylmuramoyl-L-alanine--D-glutamate ligase [Sulfurimonas sp. RIFOXYD2_FULL_34_21]DAB27594.1 MAG TPA: UDP-N-acetylmuramoyl-L-alanine--D-glutamate ligase [Sulfurimona
MKRVSLFGYGKTTKALIKLYPHAIFYDDKCVKPFTDENGFKIKPSSDFNPIYSDLEIPSPGIAPSNPLIQKARNLISEYDCFAKESPLCVWISGTNGKTTTTQMMQFLLSDKGSQEGGNIGRPLGELDKQANMWILETSSFTIHYTNKAVPNIYVLLPITPDHLSWHGDMDNYIEAKLKPVAKMREGEIAIIPYTYKDIKTSAHVITYKDENDLAAYFEIEINKVNFKGAFLMDALLAMAVDKILFDRVDYEKINTFVIDPHRQEELCDAKGRLWVNDTKATNLDATIVALKRYKDLHVHLILGGDDKGVDLNELFVYLQTCNVTIYAIGSNKEKLFNLAKEYKVTCNLCKNLIDAVEKIDKNLKDNEVALLSPAAASLDEFTSYAHRGDLFKKTVKEL